MINVNELMLGNWVRINKNFGWDAVGNIKVINIRRDSINYMQDGNASWSIPESELIGIELSPEILEKCGFKEIDDDGLFELQDATLNIRLQANYISYNGYQLIIQKQCCFIDLQHLHQLQNLYYSLTHTPLKVEL